MSNNTTIPDHSSIKFDMNEMEEERKKLDIKRKQQDETLVKKANAIAQSMEKSCSDAYRELYIRTGKFEHNYDLPQCMQAVPNTSRLHWQSLHLSRGTSLVYKLDDVDDYQLYVKIDHTRFL